MAIITQLPHDLILIILENEIISMENVVNFRSTCDIFQNMILPDKFWERKYYQSCPIAAKTYNKEEKKMIFDQISFKEKVEKALHCIQMLRYYVFLMSRNKLHNNKYKRELERFLLSIAEDSLTYCFVWDEINRISAQKSCKMFSNLTREYNFKLLCFCLKQYRFVYKQLKFLNMPTTKLVLEKQLTIMAQYFLPHASYSAIKIWLDKIAQTVLLCLTNSYPNHSIHFTSSEQFAYFRDNNINDNFWDERESKEIMDILEKYIFSEVDVHEVYELLLLSNLETQYIEYIEDCLQTYLLTITYHIVARMLGIYTRLKLNNDDIVVIWRPKCNSNNWDYAECFYMSMSSDIYPLNIRRSYQNVDFSSMKTHDDQILMTREIIRILEYKLLRNRYCAWDFNIFYNFLDRCYIKDIKDINIKTECKKITNVIEIRSNIVLEKRRPKNVKFAVGMIVTYKRLGCNIDGIIIGWHHQCDKTFLYKLKETVMFPYLRFHVFYDICKCYEKISDNQLHYIILGNGNRICYIREDQLRLNKKKISSATEIKNMEIGKYFSHFKGTRYVPNKWLKNILCNN